MKPVLEYLPKDATESFVVKFFDYGYYPTPWHFHPEYEIVLVTESTGKRFIGDNICHFGPGNLALLGPNLPHLYRNDAAYYAPDSKLHARSIVIHFLNNTFGEDFFGLPETKKIKQLLFKSVNGLEISGNTNKTVSSKLFELQNLTGFARCLKLFEILHILSESKECKNISSCGVIGINEQESERMDNVLEFLMNNFSDNITRADVAKVAYMTENAFSRYFSQRTRKTFAGYLNELRLSHANKLLLEADKSIADICYECGFNNLSNFNRQFKMVNGVNPLSYRKQYWEKGK